MDPEQTESSAVASDAKPAEAAADTSAASPAAATQDAAAESSTAQPDAKDGREALLAAVKSAIEPAPASPQESSTAKPEAKAESQDQSTEAKPEGEKPEGEQDDSKLPFHNHPRWKQVIAERDQYRQGAEQFDKIATFMESNGLSNDEVVSGFRVMALMKSDPARALEELERFAAPLREFVGQVLPADLQSKVDQGALDPDSARELARARNEAKHASERAREVTEQSRADRERQDRETARTSMYNAVAEWEAGVKSSDPDYAVKQSFVTERIRVLMAEKPPTNALEAVELAKRAHKDVTERLKPLSPRRQEERNLPGPSANDTSLVRGTPQPKSLKEAAILALRSA